MSNTFILQQGSRLILTHNGRTVTLDKQTHSGFDQVIEAIAAEDYDLALDLSNPGRALEEFYSKDQNTKLTVCGDSVLLNGTRLNPALEDRLMAIYKEGGILGPIVNFLARVKKNPSATSQRELYLFLEGNSLPLTPDGYFMAYKSVRRWNDPTVTEDDSGRPFADGDWQSIGTNHENGLPTRLRVGDRLEMNRGDVDDNRENTCSFGYHFASLHYAKTWSRWDAILLMKIDPADVVSIPSDYNNQKGRTCAYTVDSVYVATDQGDRGRDLSEAFDGPVYTPSTVTPTVTNSGPRYQVRDSNDDQVISSHRTRSEALMVMRGFRGSTYVWDTVNKRRWLT